MRENVFHWEPEMIARMKTQEIVSKLQELAPGFDADVFKGKIQAHISSEDLAEADYYPRDSVSDADEDFICIACEELWWRLAPDNPPAERVIKRFEDLMEEADESLEKDRPERAAELSLEALEFLRKNVTRDTPDGSVGRPDFFEKMAEIALYDLEDSTEWLLSILLGEARYPEVLDIAETLGECLDNDELRSFKAEALFETGGRVEAERLFHELIARHPANPMFAVAAADCCTDEGDIDASQAYLHLALEAARTRQHQPGGKEDLREVCRRLMLVAASKRDSPGEVAYRLMMEKLDAEMNAPCDCGSGRKYRRCCARNGYAPQWRF
jgi:tetratricopeptide (TPR) repeat protein